MNDAALTRWYRECHLQRKRVEFSPGRLIHGPANPSGCYVCHAYARIQELKAQLKQRRSDPLQFDRRIIKRLRNIS